MSNFENLKDIVAIVAAPASVIAGAWFAARSSAKQLMAVNDDRAREREHDEKVRATEASERAAELAADRRAADRKEARQRHEEAQEGALIATASLRGELASSFGNRHNEDTEFVREFMEATARFTFVLGHDQTAYIQELVARYMSGEGGMSWNEIDSRLSSYAGELASCIYSDLDVGAR